MGIVIPKLRQSARGQNCTLQTQFCNHDPETTVLAHLPSPVKGMGNKGNDWHAIFACHACHDALDQRKLTAADMMQCIHALRVTQEYWFENGYLAIAGDNPKPKPPSSKTIPRRPMVTP